MTTYGTEFLLSSLDGLNGFRVSGAASGDAIASAVASAGDVNGDGVDDFVIGAPLAGGGSYVVFGHTGGFLANTDVSTLDGSNGFRINGPATDSIGSSVASAGDVNGDGFDDLIIGAPGTDSSGTDSGAGYVVFGHAGGFAASLDISALNGFDGFRIDGEALQDGAGGSVASAGDINGDGFADLIVGAAGHPNGSAGGAAYVVFGRATGFSSTFALASLSGSNGFQINGEAVGDAAGRSVAAAGDINGDGFDDLIVGANKADANGADSGAAYVVFGRLGGFAATLQLSALNGSDGFQISGEAAGDDAGISVASAGDVNGDGFDDVVIGADLASPNGGGSGAAYVVFGKAGGFAANLQLSTLNGLNGFQINGEAAGDQAGFSVASAGDVNRDGFADLLVGAPLSDANGGNSGAGYVVFGRAGFAATLELSALNGGDGFQITGQAAGDIAGNAIASAGDVNADGFDDILVAADLADAPGTNSGAAYVIFGKATHGTDGDDVLDGSGANDHLAGFGGNDIIRGNGGFDTLSGGDGNDQLIGGAGLDVLAGGAGDDFLDGGDNFDVLFGDVDQLIGGAGNDTYVLGSGIGGNDQVIEAAGIDTIMTTVSRSLQFFATIENLTLLPGAVSGTGNALANTITGNAVDNVIDGAGNFDTFVGGDGSDTYFADSTIDTVVEAAGAAAGAADIVEFTGLAGQTYALADNVERLTLLGAAASNGTGNALANTINGNSAANVLKGGLGNDVIDGLGNFDTLAGGDGSDTYFVDSTIDVVVEAAGAAAGAADIVDFTGFAGQTYVLAGNVERLTLLGAAASNGTGNALANTIAGNSAANVLDGGAGNDILQSGGGKDILIGGLGRDTLVGGTGNDIFRYSVKTQSVGANVDRITDFDDSGNDRIDLSHVFAGTLHYVHNAAFSAGGQVRINDVAGPDVIVEVNLGGSLAPDMQIRLAGTTLASMSAGDFFL